MMDLIFIIRKQLLLYIARLSFLHTWGMLMGIIVLTTFLGFRASSLEIHLGYDNLLPSDNSRIETLHRVYDEFQNETYILLLANGSEDSLKAFADALKPLLESFDNWVVRVHTQIPENFLRKNYLKLISENELKYFSNIFYDPNLVPFLHNLNNAFEIRYQGKDTVLNSRWDEQETVHFLDRIQSFVDIQKEVMDGTVATNIGQKAVDAVTMGETYLLSLNKDIMLILIEPSFNITVERDTLIRNITGIEDIIRNSAIPYGITTGVTGPLIRQRDQYTSLSWEPWMILMGTLAIITFILILTYKTWINPFLVAIIIIISLIWTMGISSFLISKLNLIDVMMLSLTIFLGFDYSIHILSGYTEKRNQGLDVLTSIQETIIRFGPGILIGAFVSSLACLTIACFSSAILMGLGIIGSVSILCSMLANLLGLPTILVLRERINKKMEIVHPVQDISFSFLGTMAQHVNRYRWGIGAVLAIATGFLIQYAKEIEVEYKVLYLGSEDLPYEKVERDLIEAFYYSSDFVILTTDSLAKVRELTERAREMRTIGWVQSISDYLPDDKDRERRYRFLRDLKRSVKEREIRKQLSSHDLKMYRKEIERLEANIIELQDISFQIGLEKVYEKTVRLVGEVNDSPPRGNITRYINTLDTGMTRRELTYFQQKFSTAFKTTVIEMANTGPLGLEYLPSEIRDRFSGKSSNIFRIIIHPNENLWRNAQTLNWFADEVTSLSMNATGIPSIYMELMNNLMQEGRKLILIFLLTASILLSILLGKIKYALVGMFYILISFLWMIGIMSLIQIPYNLINLLLLPLLLIIGIQITSHILHRWKLEKNLDIVYRSSGKAILISTLGVILSVESFYFSIQHEGSSFIILFIIGSGVLFLASILIFPLFLRSKQTS